MKVIIVVYEDVDKRDTLETRMVDVRVDHMVAEFTLNEIPIQVIREKEGEKWTEDDANVEKYPLLPSFRGMKDYIKAHGEEAFLELLKEAA